MVWHGTESIESPAVGKWRRTLGPLGAPTGITRRTEDGSASDDWRDVVLKQAPVSRFSAGEGQHNIPKP